MLNYYWASTLYKNALNNYTSGRVTKMGSCIKSPSNLFLFNVCKKSIFDRSFKLVNCVKLNKELLKLFLKALIRPSLSDIMLNARGLAFHKRLNFIFPKPLTIFDFTVGARNNKISFFYLKRICVITCDLLEKEFLLHLQCWLFTEESFIPNNIFFLLKKERELLMLLYNGGFFKLSTTLSIQRTTGSVKPLKKLRPRKARIVLKTTQFLVKLTEISSRAGARLSNFKHFTLFLTKLRRIGGLGRLTQAIKILNPFFYFRKRYRGRKSFFVPLIVMPESKYKFISRSILSAVLRRTTEYHFSDRLFMEIYDALRWRGRAYKYKRSILHLANLHKFNIKRRYFRRLLRRRAFY